MKRRALLAALALGGCAATAPPPPPGNPHRVILLPDAGGGVGKVAVIGDGRETLLSAPYASARLDAGGQVVAEQLDAATVRNQYARELAALPPRPATYFLYFEPDSPVLTPESARAASGLLQEIARRPVVEVTLIGHSDKRGENAHNDTLSLTRAMWVRTQLIAQGVSGFRIVIGGQGERRPAVETPDGVDEPRNRRVEIRVR